MAEFGGAGAGVDEDAEEDVGTCVVEGEIVELDDLEYLDKYGASSRSLCFSGSWSRNPWHISIALVSSQVLPKASEFAIL